MIWNFLTNNDTYMTLIECMGGDNFWIGLLLSLNLFNTVLYFMVFKHARKKYKELERRTPVAYAFFALGAVFAFCGLAGYMTDWLALWVPHYRVKVLLLIPLTIFTAHLVFYLQRANVVEKIFELERLVNEREEKRKKLTMKDRAD